MTRKDLMIACPELLRELDAALIEDVIGDSRALTRKSVETSTAFTIEDIRTSGATFRKIADLYDAILVRMEKP